MRPWAGDLARTALVVGAGIGGLSAELVDRDPIPFRGTDVVTLLGDAAHPVLPHSGQGAAQAIVDVMTSQIQFRDGAAYERYMGRWSRLAGDAFLNWLAPAPGLRWLDVGCGSGAFTEMLIEQCDPASVHGIDPSKAQLAFARSRLPSPVAQFHLGDAMALPFQDHSFDAAVMALVIFFVPDPARGVAQMVRVTCPGGFVAAYAWDMPGRGFPYRELFAEVRDLGIAIPEAPSRDASRTDALVGLWTGAGLDDVEVREISVQRTYAGFDDYWTTILGGASIGAQLTAMTDEEIAPLKARMRARLPADADGRITYYARANAIKGRVP